MAASFTRYVISDASPGIALVTGGRSGIGRALAEKMSSLPFINHVLVASRTIKAEDVAGNPKLLPVRADVGTEDGRKAIFDKVKELTSGDLRLRYLIHSAGSIDPIKPVLEITQEELRSSLLVNVEGPLLLTTTLYPFLSNGVSAGRVLHVSSGAAHGTPPIGWAAYGISKAAFYQSFKALDREFQHLGGKVRVGSFKPGVVDTDMQAVIRSVRKEAMPNVGAFHGMKEKVVKSNTIIAKPPPNGALDSPENVAFFVEWILLGTTDDYFSNRDDSNEYDIRNSTLFPEWIPEENLPTEDA